MIIAAIALGALIVVIVLGDGFETIVLPRGIARRFRLAAAFNRVAWAKWRLVSRLWKNDGRREAILAYFGPLSLLMLLSLWALLLILGFALIHWGTGGGRNGFAEPLYLSGTTFFTLGLGDVTPHSPVARLVTVIEAGVGFGFLAVVIGYLPTVYQAFSRREVTISLLDARAGSPPTAAELLRRHNPEDGGAALNQVLMDWEHWAAELLESHISFPLLSYYRSQHDRQSWVSALTALLDTCALAIMGIRGVDRRQAGLTFAIARHAVIDLAAIFHCAPQPFEPDRLPPAELAQLRVRLADSGIALAEGKEAIDRLQEARNLYEPYIHSLARRLEFSTPPFYLPEPVQDAWQTTAWHDGQHE